MLNLEAAHKNFVEKLKNDGKSGATVVAYSKDVEQLLSHLSGMGVNLVSEIKLGHLEDFMKKLSNADYTLKSVSRKTNATRTFIKYLYSEGEISENVSLGLKHPKLETKAPRILTKMEYRALRDATRNDLRTYAMIEMLLQTGVTISELAEIKTENLTISGSTGTLFVAKKNNKEARTIPLNKAVIDAVNRYMSEERSIVKNSGYLFVTKTGNPLLIRNIRSTIDRFFKLAGVEKAKVNDLRHTFVAHHLASGVSIIYLSKIAGHKRISTTERYLQYIDRTGEQEKTELDTL
ncbi:MAG: Tyrosine recombinase XerC [candidate division WWE3 bacterium GW2011_GWF2_41_45]|uniref:Tyrosine recombinase XerC n=3 Tax=Katanobacteria TaxID=422282 RepID=A0A1F4VZK0_UNCKA|nr:MAG: Tyrosine recombinase XerC [candidate division WWE3 bacterium GW2011_GWC2_41_23]KKS10405.1 MAG: Tyrosine recombinase XerC [candidate division WWE3 bacterium GW2011_GWF2_41_45]KKS12033.1 MAG: Tyrosine recombinase XerC [candidate division WWE3 bacterium GW2011_GWF1_41_53]KKS20055.1 MAG: Tyrosine recombinase XerC [candidate division WWE3 bacterium GW2011_GWE1_41_72]KKS26604.1 MAG: Tyrosine recombinase XerC [candidate division WWE3 bacterium GW2011_GWC1_42_102]KKS28867.1 MAG: Tyrosine recom